MTNIQEFLESAGEIVADMIYDVTGDRVKLSYARVVKINDMAMHGLQMEIEGKEATPIIYFDPLYECYLEGAKFDSLVNEMFRVLMRARDAEPPEETRLEGGIFEQGELSVRVLEIDRNTEYLKTRPFRDLGNGFAAVCDVVVFDETGSWRSSITDDIAEEYDGDVDELLDRALENAGRIDPPVMMSMEMMLEAMMARGEKEEPVGLHVKPGATSYVLTNKSKHFGASALFYPGVAEKIAEKLHGGYFALPGSLSEFIILPGIACDDFRELERIVKRVNTSSVPEEEILSDRVLRYDAEKGRLEAVS